MTAGGGTLLARLTEALEFRAAHPRDSVGYPLDTDELAATIALVEAAQHLHAGFTCVRDPMDVDERIFRLGKALAPFLAGRTG